MKIIGLEEHYLSPWYNKGAGLKQRENAVRSGEGQANLVKLLSDLGENRIAVMDEAGIQMQVLSINAPGTEQLEPDEAMAVARETNDFLASVISKYPDRYSGFATLPTPSPDKAAAELEFRVQKHGFKGAIINGHVRGRYLDDKFFWPIFACAESLDVPIYIHPTLPPKAVIDTYYRGFSPEITFMLAGPGWGWHIETAVHIIRMIIGGVFDKYPRLQIIIGHLGEVLPFMLERTDHVMSPEKTGLKRPVAQCLRENIYYTFSGFNYVPTFLDTLLEVGIDRIMFSADHPYGTMEECRAFLEQLPVTTADKEKIAHGNAERLLKL